MMLATVVGNVLVVAGAGLIASAAVGLLRLPDVYNRTNAVAKAAALGVTLVLAGVMFLIPTLTAVLTLLAAIAAQLFTAPIAGYAVGRAAYRSGAPLTGATHRDELAPRLGRRRPPVAGGAAAGGLGAAAGGAGPGSAADGS
jgi:multicomponent Na+:H+ antiporter subunit G